MPVDVLSFAYAATVAAGGIVGYAKAAAISCGVDKDNSLVLGSVVSLGAGLLFGGLLCYGAYQTSQNPNNYLLLLGTTAALGGLMGYRFYNSRKFMPAGLVTILSVGMILRFAARSAGIMQTKPAE